MLIDPPPQTDAEAVQAAIHRATAITCPLIAAVLAVTLNTAGVPDAYCVFFIVTFSLSCRLLVHVFVPLPED